MGRLIDFDICEKQLTDFYKSSLNNHDAMLFVEFMAQLENIPTAYDVEKVVEQLQQQANQYNRRALELVKKSTEAGVHNKGKACSYEHAIEIVRTNGGSNECEDNYCEWKKPQNMQCCIGYHNGVSFLIEHYMIKQFKHCPFCGKFIKILEVE